MSDSGAREERRPERKRIFVVNGSPAFLELMRDFLAWESYEVTIGLTASVDFDRILAFEPHLIIVDLVVFEESGWHLLEHLHENANTNQIPVVIVSTSEALLDRARTHVERYGGDYYLAKPVDLDDLLKKVHAAIGSSPR